MRLHSKIYGWDFVWKDFAEEVRGRIITEDSTPESTLLAISVPVPGKPWSITFTPCIHKAHGYPPGTTAAISYRPEDDLTFAIHTEKWLDHFGKLLGAHDIQVSDYRFDKRFVVRGNDKVKVLDVFSDTGLRDLLLSLPALQLQILTDSAMFMPCWGVPPGHHVLAYSQEVLVDDYNQLRSIYDVLVLVLNQLSAIGSTAAPDAGVLPPVAVHNHLLNIQ